MSGRIFYICGGRSFRSDRLGRKIQGIVQCWRGLGYEVETVCGGDFYPSYNTAEDYVKAKAEFYHKWYRKLPFLNPFVNSCSERRDISCDALMFKKLSSLVKQKRPDLIWERSNRLCSAGLTIARQNDIMYVLEWKDNIIKCSISLYHRRAVELEKRKNSESDYVVVESNKIKEDLIVEGISAAKIFVAHNAVNPDEFKFDPAARQSYRSKWAVKDNEILAGYLGSFTWYQDVKRLVLAADILRNRGKTNIKIFLAGTGKDYEEVRQLAQKMNLIGTNIILHSWIPQDIVPKVLSALDIAVLPGSTDIICPIKVQEYMATELPTVLPDYVCNREVITDWQTGVFFEPKDEQSLADKLTALADDNQTRTRIGKKARQEVLEKFTWEKTWGKVLQQILSNKNKQF